MADPIKLSEYAKANKLTYHQAFALHQNKKINSFKEKSGAIMVGNQPAINENIVTSNIKTNIFDQANGPLAIGFNSSKIEKINYSEADTKGRTNRSAYIEPYDRFANIDQAFIPIRYDNTINDQSGTSIRRVLGLCIKSYYAFAIVRNVIDVMTCFCASKLYLKGGSKKSRQFFEEYFKSVKMDNFCKKFFQEFWKTSNVYIYKHLSLLKDSDIKDIQKGYGLTSKATQKVQIPIKYSILNPIDIEVQESLNYFNPIYRKLLSDYELARLRNPQTEQDKLVLRSLSPEDQRAIKQKGASQIYINLDTNIIKAVYNGKADYESYAVPLVYSVLDTLEAKTQLLKMDLAIAKTCQHAVLLITHGYEGKDGAFNYNQKVTEALQTIFTNESVGRVLVSDFTVKGQFLIPQIGEILDPKKYDIIQQDLEEGLGHVLLGGGSSGEKFANQQAKVKIFIERLKNAREIFLEEFLNDEIVNICDELGFRDYPTAHFEEIDIEDSNEYKRIVTQLAQFGFLTPQETFDALETERLPSKEDSLENQVEYKKLRDKGYYEPIMGGIHTKLELADKQVENSNMGGPSKITQMNGRPPGSKSPQTTKKISPIGTGNLDTELYSLEKIKTNTILAFKLEEEVISLLKKKHKLKQLNESQNEIVGGIVNLIITDHTPDLWLSKAKEYTNNPVSQNPERQNQLLDITYKHQVNDFIGGILLNSSQSQNAKS